MKKLIYFCLMPLFLVAATGQAECNKIIKDFHESFDVERGMGLRLKHGDGNVTLKRWDKDILDIEIRYSAEYKSIGSGKRDFTVEFHRKRNTIEVLSYESSTIIGIQIFNINEYTYTIHAPDYIALDLQGDDGELYIDDWRANIEIRLDDGNVVLSGVECEKTKIRIEDGDIDIEDHSGNIDIDSDDGRIEISSSTIPYCRIRAEDGPVNIRNCEGDFDIEVDDGDVDLYRLSTSKLYFQSSDGDLDVQLRGTGMLDLDIRTDDGDVTLNLEEGISAVFTIDVDDGRISVDLPDASKVRKGKDWISGTLLDGNGRIRIRTQDGNVRLKETR